MPQRRSVTGNRRRKRRVDAVSGVRGGIEAKKCSGRTPSGKAACDDCPEMVVQRRRRDLTTTCLPNLTNCRCAGRHLISSLSSLRRCLCYIALSQSLFRLLLSRGPFRWPTAIITRSPESTLSTLKAVSHTENATDWACYPSVLRARVKCTRHHDVGVGYRVFLVSAADLKLKCTCKHMMDTQHPRDRCL